MDKIEFIQVVSKLIETEKPFKITISKPRTKGGEELRRYLKPIQLSEKIMIQVVHRNKTNDVTKNIEPNEAASFIEHAMNEEFYNLELLSDDRSISVLQSKKGKFTATEKKTKNNIQLESHNRKKNRLVEEDAPFLRLLGLASENGKVHAKHQDKYRQINKFLEILNNLIEGTERKMQITDMGSGKGYLTFATHMYLQSKIDLSTTGIELRKNLVDKCNHTAQELEWDNLNFEEGSIADFEEGRAIDMVIALHACDIATDMAIAQGIKAQAKYIIVSPCCHKQIRKAMSSKGSRIDAIIKHGIFMERQAEMITDTIRALIMEARGYEVKIFEFISSEHTSKNIIITAKYKNKVNKNVLKEVEKLKEEFGIQEHFLESILV